MNNIIRLIGLVLLGTFLFAATPLDAQLPKLLTNKDSDDDGYSSTSTDELLSSRGQTVFEGKTINGDEWVDKVITITFNGYSSLDLDMDGENIMKNAGLKVSSDDGGGIIIFDWYEDGEKVGVVSVISKERGEKEGIKAYGYDYIVVIMTNDDTTLTTYADKKRGKKKRNKSPRKSNITLEGEMKNLSDGGSATEDMRIKITDDNYIVVSKGGETVAEGKLVKDGALKNSEIGTVTYDLLEDGEATVSIIAMDLTDATTSYKKENNSGYDYLILLTSKDDDDDTILAFYMDAVSGSFVYD